MMCIRPRWIETDNPGTATLPTGRIPNELKTAAAMTCLLAERFTLVAWRGDSSMILQPSNGFTRSLPPARTMTLLALIRAYEHSPVLTADGVPLPSGGFVCAGWLSHQIGCLTQGTRLLFHPGPDSVRIAIRRLKDGLADILDRSDLIESSRGLGYRFRVWPSLITVIQCPSR